VGYGRIVSSGKRGLRDRFWREGLHPRVLTNTEGDSIDGERGLLEVERGAAHSNMQGKRDKSGNSFLDCREGTEEKGDKVR